MDVNFLGKIIDAGVGLYSSYQKDRARQDYSKALREKEQYNYNQQKAAYDAYQQYAQGVGGGDNGAAVHAANEAARLQANAHAQELLKQNYALANEQLKPYAKMGERLIKPAEATYKAGLEGAMQLNEALSTPEAMQQLQQTVTPLSAIYNQLPNWMRQ